MSTAASAHRTDAPGTGRGATAERSDAAPARTVMPRPLAGGLVLRPLCRTDAAGLADYFDSLSSESKRRFQPHPLTAPHAAAICSNACMGVLRMVVAGSGSIVGYFILDPDPGIHETERYRRQGIDLQAGLDHRFAPSVADAHQNRGIASAAMPHLVRLARERGARSLVLMGGTQATNARAIAFYEKVGFRRYGGYWTEVFNHDMRLAFDH
jgi:GNAT superfamily N-acetyltransferase